MTLIRVYLASDRNQLGKEQNRWDAGGGAAPVALPEGKVCNWCRIGRFPVKVGSIGLGMAFYI